MENEPKKDVCSGCKNYDEKNRVCKIGLEPTYTTGGVNPTELPSCFEPLNDVGSAD